ATTLQSVRATRAKAQEVVQRNKAEGSEKKAVAAQANETKLREQAQVNELIARQRAYASDMNVAMQAFHDNDFGRAQDLLNRQRPQPGQKDLRGWEWRYLWQQTRSDALFTLCQQSSKIESLATSADGHFLAVGVYHKGGVTVWDLRTRQEIAHLAKSDEYVCSAFSPTEPLLAFTSFTVTESRSPKWTLHLWNAATRQMVLEKPVSAIDGMKFSSDGRTLAIAFTGEILLLRIPDGTQLTNYPVPSWNVMSADGFTTTTDLSLAAYPYQAFNPQKVGVIDLRNGKELWNAAASPGFVNATAFSPDGKILATAGDGEADIRLWDVATGKQIGQLEGHSSSVNALVFWPDGKKLASASIDRTIRIWDLASRKCLDVLRGSRDKVLRLALLPDNKTLVSGCQDGTVCFWDTSVTHPREEYITLPEKFYTGYNLVNGDGQSDLRMANFSFAPDSQSILTLTYYGEIARWTGIDFQKKELLLTNAATDYGRSGLVGNGRFFMVASPNNVISIWDISKKTLWRQFTNPAPAVPAGNVLNGLRSSVAFLDNGNKLVTLSPGRFHEWDLVTGSEIQSWQAPVIMERRSTTVFSPDEQLCVTIDLDGNVTARNLADKKTSALPLHLEETLG
ncbi:MAG: WD40 repeat domain-containing protein, partial [Limisphaerales bacterium]